MGLFISKSIRCKFCKTESAFAENSKKHLKPLEKLMSKQTRKKYGFGP
jgi:hypothetical protein